MRRTGASSSSKRVGTACCADAYLRLIHVLLEIADRLDHCFGFCGVEVADRNHADNGVVFNHRDMADAFFAHQVAELFERSFRLAAGDGGGHDISNNGLRGVLLLGDDAREHVALGEDSCEMSAGFKNKDRADAVHVHELGSFEDRGVRFDGDNSAATEAILFFEQS